MDDGGGEVKSKARLLPSEINNSIYTKKFRGLDGSSLAMTLTHLMHDNIMEVFFFPFLPIAPYSIGTTTTTVTRSPPKG